MGLSEMAADAYALRECGAGHREDRVTKFVSAKIAMSQPRALHSVFEFSLQFLEF